MGGGERGGRQAGRGKWGEKGEDGETDIERQSERVRQNGSD